MSIKRTKPTKAHPQLIHDLYKAAERTKLSNRRLIQMTSLSNQTICACLGGVDISPTLKSLEVVANALKMDLIARPTPERKPAKPLDEMLDVEQRMPIKTGQVLTGVWKAENSD